MSDFMLHNFEVISVALTSIVAMLLRKGHTAHSCVKLLPNLHELSVTALKINRKEVNNIKNARIIIWDEAPVAKKYG